MEGKKRKWSSTSSICSSKGAFHKWGSLVDLHFHFSLLQSLRALQPAGQLLIHLGPTDQGCWDVVPPVAYLVNLPSWWESLDIQSCTVLGFVCSSDKVKGATQSSENPQLSRPNKFFITFLYLWAWLTRNSWPFWCSKLWLAIFLVSEIFGADVIIFEGIYFYYL